MKSVFVIALCLLATSASAADLCEGKTRVVIESAKTQLHLCKAGKVQKSFLVNLGKGGMGKRKQGDLKTPLGTYGLSKPRASGSGFTYFVPINYPTKAQRAAGYTGGAIGIHGPPDYLPQMLVDMAFTTPWTEGCVMVRTKAEIEEIRAWVLENAAKQVVIL